MSILYTPRRRRNRVPDQRDDDAPAAVI
jgi:hypothetical protein